MVLPEVQFEDKSDPIKEQLKALDKFFIGSGDVSVPYTCVLEPGVDYLLEANIPDTCLHPLDYNNQLIALSQNIRSSTRSRLAQSGLELTGVHFIYNHLGQLIARFHARIEGPRAIQLEEGTGVAGLYSEYGANLLLGPNLYDSVMKYEQVQISGEFGKDWFFYFLDDSDGLTTDKNYAANSVAIALKLADKRFGIIKSPDPITVTEQSKDVNHLGARQVLNQTYFYELTPSDRAYYWVGETRSKVKLSAGVNGVLNFSANIGKTWVPHASSLLIKSGTDNTIRTEFWMPKPGGNHRILYPEARDYENQYVFLHLYIDREMAVI